MAFDTWEVWIYIYIYIYILDKLIHNQLLMVRIATFAILVHASAGLDLKILPTWRFHKKN